MGLIRLVQALQIWAGGRVALQVEWLIRTCEEVLATCGAFPSGEIVALGDPLVLPTKCQG